MTQTQSLGVAAPRRGTHAAVVRAAAGDLFEREIARARRHGRPLSLVRLTVTDAAAGPAAWSRSAVLTRLTASLRQVDLPHVDGSSLLVLCPDTSAKAGRQLLDRLMAAAEHVDVGASGVATFPDDGLTFEALLESVGHTTGPPSMPPRATDTPARRRYRLLKRVAELALILLTLPVTALVLGLCAIAIRLDSPGPVFFRQVRTGRNGRRFTMYKLRTMVADAESRKAQLSAQNVIGGPDFKVLGDPRITRVGRLLRMTSLDELPQLWNVAAGHMALIGPRPTSFSPDTYDLWHTRRLDATPGLTGLWQVAGRNTTSFDERLRLDIYYLEHESLRLDLTILYLTVKSMLQRAGH